MHYKLKLIDFGFASTDFKKIYGLTELNFYNGKSRIKNNIKYPETSEERVKIELFALSIIAL